MTGMPVLDDNAWTTCEADHDGEHVTIKAKVGELRAVLASGKGKAGDYRLTWDPETGYAATRVKKSRETP